MLLLAPLIAAAFFLWRIDREHLWLDEAYSAAMAAHDFGDIIRIVEQDVHPPLYYLALKAVSAVFGTGEHCLRVLSALFAIGLVLLGIGPVRRIFGRDAAYVYSALAVLSPGVVCFAQEARMYTMAAFFVLSAALYGIEAVRHGRKGDFVRFGVLVSIAMYTHYFALAASAVTVLLLIVFSAVRMRSRLKPLLVTATAAAVLYLPWVPSFLVQIHRVEAGFWIPDPNWFLIKFSLMAPYAYKYEDIMYPWASVAAMVLSAVAISWGLWAHRRNAEMLLPLSFLVGIHLLTIVVGIVVSIFIAPILMPRYLISCIGLFLVSVAVGIAALPKASARLGASALILALLLPADYHIQTDTFHGPFREVAAIIAKRDPHDATIVHEDVQTLFPMQWGLPHATHVLVTDIPSVQALAGGVYPEEGLDVAKGLGEVLKRGEPFWLVDYDLSDSIVTERLTPPPGWRIQNEDRFAPPFSFTKIALTRWAPERL